MQLLYAIDLGRLGEKTPEAAAVLPSASAREEQAGEPDGGVLPTPDRGILLDAIDAEFNANAEVREAATTLAIDAWLLRDKADAICGELAPDWPASRQPAVDRAILRLALYEIASGRTPMKVAINEAVELAKSYAGEESPMFINAVLDKAAAQLPTPPAGHAAIPAEMSEAATPAADAATAPPREPVDPNRWLNDALQATEG